MLDLAYVRRELQFGGLSAILPILARLEFRLSATKRAQMLEFLGKYLESRKPLDSAVVVLRDRYADTGRPLSGMLRDWTTGMGAGRSFSEVARGCFTDQELMIISAGEISGTLDKAFAQAAMVARANARMVGSVVAELSQPTVYFVALLVMCVWFATGIAPDLQRSVPASALSESQRSVFAVTDAIATWWGVVVAGLAVLAVVCTASLSRVKGELRDRILDRFPPWSIYKTYSSATLLIALGALVHAGIPLDESIRRVRHLANPWMQSHLTTMLRRLGNAANPGAALDVGLLDQEMSDLVAVYSATGTFDEAMAAIGREAIETAIGAIKRRAALARVMVLCAIGWALFQGIDTILGMADATQRSLNTRAAYTEKR